MAIKREPFRKYNLEKSIDTFTIRLNPQERAVLEEAKRVIMQERDSTAYKILAEIGIRNVTQDSQVRFIIERLFKNKRLNAISGVPMQEPELPEM
jgi:hypothetical protein